MRVNFTFNIRVSRFEYQDMKSVLFWEYVYNLRLCLIIKYSISVWEVHVARLKFDLRIRPHASFTNISKIKPSPKFKKILLKSLYGQF